jgi:type II secretory pathway component GspD/PulD (secretin)
MLRLTILCGACLALLLFQASSALAQAKTRTKQTAPKVVVLVERVYPIADLIVPISEDVSTGDSPAKQAEPAKTLESKLMNLLCSSVAPESWKDNGGLATMQYFPLGMSLVIRQTADVHERIAALLAELRRPHDVEVAVELRLLQVSNEAALEVERIAEKENKGQILLRDEQLLRLLKSTQISRETQIMQAPKLTVFNGQRARINVVQAQCFLTGFQSEKVNGKVVYTPQQETIETGIKAAIRPLVSADRGTVELSLCLNLANLDAPIPLVPVQLPIPHTVESPRTGSTTNHQPIVFQQFLQQPKVSTIKVERVFKIPDGQTVLVDAGTVTVESRSSEYGPPVLSRVPYVNRLFRTVGYGQLKQRLFVLVTPRIIINQEEEQLLRSRANVPSLPAPASTTAAPSQWDNTWLMGPSR